MNQPQHMRPDGDSEQYLQNGNQDPKPKGYFGQERRHDRHGEHDQYRVIAEHRSLPLAALYSRVHDARIIMVVAWSRDASIIYECDPSAAGSVLRLAADNRRALETAVDASGRRLQIISMDDAYEVQTPHDMFSRSYVNFYIANGGIVMPRFGVPGDARALAVIRAAFPDREVVQVDITQLASGGGGTHCITRQQPA